MKLVSSLVSSSAIVVPKKSSSYPITRRSGHPPQVAATVGGSGPATSTCRRIDSDGTVSTITKTSLPLVQISRLQRFVNASRSMKEMMEWLIGRSRRKAEVNNKENRNPPTTSKKTGPSLSQASASKIRKAPQSELCVADSFDDAMLDKITSKPYGIDKNEWLATHTLALFDNVNALCGSVSELCTPANCGTMSYPGVSKAYFIDEKGKRHLYSASQYVDCVMSFCERSRKNEEIFPTKFGSTFLPDFDQHCRRMIRYLWHCCGHLYSKHWDQLSALNLRPQCGLVLAHIQRIARDFGLLDSKELAILNKTLYLVRPPYVNEPPAKRIGGVDDQLSGSGADSVSGIRWNGVPAAKSGSWGGHPTPTVLSSCKNYAQTC